VYGGLQRKIDQIQRSLQKIKDERAAIACRCRGRDRKVCITRYHSVVELKKILWVPCPVHGPRDPGFITWTAQKWPLNREDWEFCNCPPRLWRDYLMGKRPEPTRAEWDQEIIDHNLENERRRLEPEEVSRKRSENESNAIDAVIREFEQALSAARGLNGE
jgi:hypothetical protein